jgi:ComF family protein
MDVVLADRVQNVTNHVGGRLGLSCLLDLVCGIRCPVCGSGLTGTTPWCEACARSMVVWEESFCPRCRCFRPADFSECSVCRAPARPAFVTALGAYDDALKSVVTALKYGGARALAEAVGITMAENHSDLSAIETVVAVPTSPGKVRRRGFGHAEEIALNLSRHIGLSYRPGALFQVRDIADQTRLSGLARRANLEGAFAADPEDGIKDRTVLVVDDVMTTGATIEEAARAVTEAGAHRVCAAIVALNLGGPDADRLRQ